MQALSETVNLQSLFDLSIKMAEEGDERMNRGEGKKKRENLGNLLKEGTVKNVQDLEARMKNSALDLFEVCEWNISPLMVACLLGCKDIVRYLLEKGADPNEKCTEECNTPLHYACLLSLYIRESFSSLEWLLECKQDQISSKEDIVKLLFEHGAVLERNTLGFLPIHCAALFTMENVVDYFLGKDHPITDVDKLKALELLGVSQSLMLVENTKAYCTFVSAVLLRHDIGGEFPFPTELGQYLNSNECTTFDELHKLKHDQSAMYIHGLLVGERVLPEKLKQKCLWPSMLYPDYDVEKFFGACQYGIKLEMSSRLAVGTVLEGIQEFLMNSDPDETDETLLMQIASCLEKNKEILMIVESEHIAAHSRVFSRALGYILSELIYRCNFSTLSYDLLFMTTVDVIKVYSEQTSAYESTESVAQSFFDYVVELYDNSSTEGSEEMRNVIVRLNHVLPLVLQYEHTMCTKDRTSHNMLQMTVLLLRFEQDLDVICALTHKLVRYGCPIETKTFHHEETAKDIALRIAANFRNYHPELKEILALVSKPSEVLSLQELAARCVLRSKVPYSLGTVPSTVFDFLNGEDFL